MLSAILLVGGKATRLRSVTNDTIAKCMVDINGVPFIKYQLDMLAKYYVCQYDRVILATGFNSKSILDWVDEHRDEYPFSILYSEEMTPLGTGGAILNAFRYVPEYSPCVVFNGDVWNDVDLWEFMKPSNSFKMSLVGVDDCTGLGVVELDELGTSISKWNEKTKSGPGLINRGIYYIPANYKGFDSYPSKFSFELDWMPYNYDQVVPIIQSGDFIDIGTPKNYESFVASRRVKNN